MNEIVTITGIRKKSEMNIAAWRVLWNGKDITKRLDPDLSELTLTEKSGKEADELSITIVDPNIQFKLPKKGDEITVALGWEKGSDIEIGLIEKGKFIVSDFQVSGHPDVLTINAKSADFTKTHHNRKPQKHIGKTLGQITRDVARALGLGAKIALELENIQIPAVLKTAKSDLALLKELGELFDAIATIKNKTLIFAKKGAKTTPGGRQFPTFEITRHFAPKFQYSEEAKTETDGVTAKYHDRKEAKTKKVTSGKSGGKTLRKVYASESEAAAAAKTHHAKSNRATKKLELDLSLGRADISPPAKIKVSNYRPEIDAINWHVTTATHTFGAKGLATKLTLESD